MVCLSKKEANKSATAREESELCVVGEWGRWEGFTNELVSRFFLIEKSFKEYDTS